MVMDVIILTLGDKGSNFNELFNRLIV